jgi:hypothetical protein
MGQKEKPMGYFILFIFIWLVRTMWIYHIKLNNIQNLKKAGGKEKRNFENIPKWRKPFVLIDILRGAREE